MDLCPGCHRGRGVVCGCVVVWVCACVVVCLCVLWFVCVPFLRGNAGALSGHDDLRRPLLVGRTLRRQCRQHSIRYFVLSSTTALAFALRKGHAFVVNVVCVVCHWAMTKMRPEPSPLLGFRTPPVVVYGMQQCTQSTAARGDTLHLT